MAELAAAYPDRAVSVREVARCQNLSPKYLEQILAPLKAAGLVRAVRGVHGGYMLSKPPETIALAQVFGVLEGSPAPVHCVDDPGGCPHQEVCPTRDTWVQIKEAVSSILEGTTLKDLAERMKAKSGGNPLMYTI
jgi:Rrf2 family protein